MADDSTPTFPTPPTPEQELSARFPRVSQALIDHLVALHGVSSEHIHNIMKAMQEETFLEEHGGNLSVVFFSMAQNAVQHAVTMLARGLVLTYGLPIDEGVKRAVGALAAVISDETSLRGITDSILSDERFVKKVREAVPGWEPVAELPDDGGDKVVG